MGILAGDDLAGELVQPVDQGQIDLRGGEKFVLPGRGGRCG